MKYSQPVGSLACIALIATCFFPWSYVAEVHLTITGVNGGESLGKPGLFNIIICGVMLLLFLVPKIWAKRINVFLGAFNIAWSIRNFIIVGSCGYGICPEKRWGIYALLLLSLFIEVMTFLPPGKIAEEKDTD